MLSTLTLPFFKKIWIKQTLLKKGFTQKQDFKMKKINNTGQTHVETILSFSLFVGVLIILFIFINPFSKTSEKNNDIEQVFEIFINEISLNAGKLSVIVNTNDDCYIRPSQFGEKFVEIQKNIQKEQRELACEFEQLASQYRITRENKGRVLGRRLGYNTAMLSHLVTTKIKNIISKII